MQIKLTMNSHPKFSRWIQPWPGERIRLGVVAIGPNGFECITEDGVACLVPYTPNQPEIKTCQSELPKTLN